VAAAAPMIGEWAAGGDGGRDDGEAEAPRCHSNEATYTCPPLPGTYLLYTMLILLLPRACGATPGAPPAAVPFRPRPSRRVNFLIMESSELLPAIS
jgi:hypothetical protein